MNADEAAAALAIGLGADRLLFLTDVDGLILDGAVVDEIDSAAAIELLGGGTLEGGIIPKLTAAVTAARGGVPASIGRTRCPHEPPPAWDRSGARHRKRKSRKHARPGVSNGHVPVPGMERRTDTEV